MPISDLAEYIMWWEITALNSTTPYRTVVPFDGTVKEIRSIIPAAITTADAVLTAKIAPVSAAGVAGTAVAITGGTITITQSGSAIGDVDFAKPTAARRVKKGDMITIESNGAAGAQVARGYFLIDRS